VKVLGRVVCERLRWENARIVDEMVNRAKLADGGECDLLRRRWLADISVDEGEVR
jgi:hypothetical protein